MAIKLDPTLPIKKGMQSSIKKVDMQRWTGFSLHSNRSHPNKQRISKTRQKKHFPRTVHSAAALVFNPESFR